MVTLIVAFAALAGPAALAAEKPFTPVLIMTGAHSHVPGPRATVVGDQKSFEEVWHRHTLRPSKVYETTEPAPKIDFAHHMAVFVFLGAEQNSMGINLVQSVSRDDATVFRFTEYGVQTAGPDGGGIETQPWLMAIVDKSDKKLLFERGQTPKGGQPGNWKPFATISLKGKADSYASPFSPPPITK